MGKIVYYLVFCCCGRILWVEVPYRRNLFGLMVSERWFCQDGKAMQEMTGTLGQDAERSHPQPQAGCREQVNWK